MSAAQTELIIQGRHRDPFSYLGPHKGQIRAWLPQAINASVLVGDQVIPMKRSNPAGLFVAKTEAAVYRFRITLPSGQWQELDDPYRFPALLTPFELHLHGEGTNYESYHTLGAHADHLRGRATGVRFAVWARTRKWSALSATYNSWDRTPPSDASARRRHVGDFLPGLAAGAHYKYSVMMRARPRAGSRRSVRLLRRSAAENGVHRLARSRITHGATRRGWKRAATPNWLREPVSIYEVHLESWMRGARQRMADVSGAGREAAGVCSREWASRTSNCCRSWSIRFRVRGATR